MRDPYLEEGQVCWVWDDDLKFKQLGIFIKISGTGHKIFCIPGYIGVVQFDNYWPVGTEWDFAPDLAVCSTVDSDGKIYYWDGTPIVTNQMGKEIWFFGDAGNCMSGGICPDKERVRNWKKSLRMRPEWAKEK